MLCHGGPIAEPEDAAYVLQHTRGVVGFFGAMRWPSLEGLPVEAYLAPMGLYSLRRTFAETFERVRTPLVDQYRAAVAKGADSVGTLGTLRAEA